MSTLIFGPDWPDPSAVHLLTERQQVVLALMVRGTSNKEMALRLDVGLRTIEGARTNAANALGIEVHMLLIWAARNAEHLPMDVPERQSAPVIVSAPGKKSVVQLVAPVKAKARDRTAKRDDDPTEEQIAERAAAIRLRWELGEPTYDDNEDRAPGRGLEAPCLS
jgi:DNA-binding CsgD family transcriptional regulator